MSVVDLAHLRRVQLVIDALADIQGDTASTVAVIACHDAAVAFMLGFSMGLTPREIAKNTRELLDEETARQAS